MTSETSKSRYFLHKKLLTTCCSAIVSVRLRICIGAARRIKSFDPMLVREAESSARAYEYSIHMYYRYDKGTKYILLPYTLLKKTIRLDMVDATCNE